MQRTPFLAALTALAACAASSSPPDNSAETQKLLETDRAWAVQASAGTNADSIVAYWTDDATIVGVGQPTVTGKAAIREMIASSFKTPGFHVTWTPERAVVSGDMGYTTGTN